MLTRGTSGHFQRGASLATAALCITLALVVPAAAQFWQNWGAPQRPAQRPQQQQQQHYNPFGGGWWGSGSQQQQDNRGVPQRERERDAPTDYSRAPSPQRQPHPGPTTTTVAVVGDGMADWLAYGLEDAFSEKPEVAVLRKHRTTSGLVRYDSRRDIEWPQVIKDIVAADKPKFLVMMVGVNDRQPIRERVAPGRAGAASPAIDPTAPTDAELHAQQSADQQNAEMLGGDDQEPRDEPSPAARGNSAPAGQSGPFEFHTEKWELGYSRRIDAAIAAMKSAGVPVIWVGLPSQRNSRASSDSAYLNELFRQRAEKAGVIFVDVWDGFVDEAGRFTSQGPDFEGQIRRLRSGDGVYFTRAGARKLAHYVEREIQRILASRAVPAALPEGDPLPALVTSVPVVPGNATGPATGPAAGAAARPTITGPRPLAGPVIPLTVPTGGELLGAGGQPRPVSADAIATRVLTNGEPIQAPGGRADDFSWPRGSNPLLAITTLPPDPVPQRARAQQPPAAAKQQQGTRPAVATGTTTANSPQPKADGRPPVQQQPAQAKPAPKRQQQQQRPPGPSAEIAPRSGIFSR